MTPIEIGQAVAVAGAVATLVGHLVAIFGTPSWLPPTVVSLINFVATNYGKSANANKTTDN